MVRLAAELFGDPIGFEQLFSLSIQIAEMLFGGEDKRRRCDFLASDLQKDVIGSPNGFIYEWSHRAQLDRKQAVQPALLILHEDRASFFSVVSDHLHGAVVAIRLALQA